MKQRIFSLMLMVFCMVVVLVVPADAAIQTSDYYGYYNTNNDTRSQDLFMDAICIISGDKASTYYDLLDILEAKVGAWCYDGLYKDLNDGAGGKYVYLGWTTTTDPNNAITGVRILNRGSYNSTPANTYTDANGVVWYLANAGEAGSVAPRLDDLGDNGGAVDLNEGAGGDYLYLYVTKDPDYGVPLSCIAASEDEKSPADPGDGYEKVVNFGGFWQDVNEDAGGDYIYLSVGTVLQPIDAEDVAALKTLVARAEALMKAGGYNISSNDYDYKFAKYNILSKWNGTKYANGHDVTQAKVEKAITNLQENLDTMTTTLTFDAGTNGGTIYTAKTYKQTYTIGENATVTVDVSGVQPTPKSGYEFVGWSTNKNATTGSKTTVTAKPGATYYAIFRKEISVTFTYYENYPLSNTESVTAYLYNTASAVSVDVPSEVPTEFTVNYGVVEDFTLLGWRTDKNSEAPQYTGSALLLSSDTVLYAVYQAPVFLDFETWGGSVIDTMVEYQYRNVSANGNSKVSFILPTVEIPPEGCAFRGWNYAANAWPSYDAGDTFTTAVDYTMYAYYEYSIAKVTIGDTTTYYYELQEALDAAMAGTEDAPGVVTLMQDITIGLRENYDMNGHEWTKGVGILDLNGYTLTHLEEESAGRAAIEISGGQLTIRDSKTGGKIDSLDAGYNSGTLGVKKGSLILESGSICSVSPYAAVYVENSGSFTVNGGKVVGNGEDGSAVHSSANTNGTVTLNICGGELYGSQVAVYIGNAGTKANISGGTLTGGIAPLISEKGSVFISGGTFASEGKNADDGFGMLNLLGDASLQITGGTYADGFSVLKVESDGVTAAKQELKTILSEGYAFYTGDSLVTLTAGQTDITETVTVKACTHIETLVSNNNGTHNVLWSCCDAVAFENVTCTFVDNTCACGYTVPVIDPVAEVSGKQYATLAAAVEAAQAGDTITLIADIEITKETTFVLADGVTLDLNGHTVKAADAALLVKGNNIIIKNGTFACCNTKAYYLLTIEDGSATLEGLTFDKGGVKIRGNAVVTLKENTITANQSGFKYAVWAYGKAKVNIESGTYLGGKNGYDAFKEGNAKIYVYGGTYKFKNIQNYIPSGAELELIKNADGTYSVVPVGAVAEVNGTKYETLQAAIDAAASGATVKLLESIETANQILIDKSMTLDLGAYTITSTHAEAALRIVSDESIAVTINATTGGITAAGFAINSGNIVIDEAKTTLTINGGNYLAGGQSAVYQNNGVCTINGGSYKATAQTDTANGEPVYNTLVLNNKDYYEGSFVINDGSFYGFNPACLSINKHDHHDHDSIAEGYTGVLDANGWFTVTEGSLAYKIVCGCDYPASAHEHCYASYEEALAALETNNCQWDKIVEIVD